jgi:LPS export ABC transporter protein LptC
MMSFGKKMWRCVGTACAAVPLLVGCADDTQAPVAAAGVQEMAADFVTYEMEQYLTRDGVRTGVVISDSSYVYDDSAAVRLFGVEMTLYEESGTGREKARVTSEHGRLNQRTEEMTAWGNAVLQVPDQGLKVESPELHYDPGQNEIRSDSVTTLILDGAVSRGTCFRSDLEFTDFSVCEPVGAIPRRLPGEGGEAAPGGGTGRPEVP